MTYKKQPFKTCLRCPAKIGAHRKYCAPCVDIVHRETIDRYAQKKKQARQQAGAQ